MVPGDRRSRGNALVATRESAPPLTLEQAAQYLNVNERFIRRLVAERRVPYYKVGRLLRFRANDLEDLLEGGRVDSQSAKGTASG
jgi:excisionase family DNA binding protein